LTLSPPPTDGAYTYTLSLDTNVPSLVRKYYESGDAGTIGSEFPKFLIRLSGHLNGTDILPYLFENIDRIGEEDCLATLRACIALFRCDVENLKATGEISCPLPPDEIEDEATRMVSHLQSEEREPINEWALRNWTGAYCTLLAAASVQLQHRRKSPQNRMRILFNLLDDTLLMMPQREVMAAYGLFEGDSYERFFRRVQPGATDLLGLIRNLAWDISIPRTMADNVAATARGSNQHRDFVVPHLATFDGDLADLLVDQQANGLYTFLMQGAKTGFVYPTPILERYASAAEAEEQLFAPEKRRRRIESTQRMIDDSDYRAEIVARAETLATDAQNG